MCKHNSILKNYCFGNTGVWTQGLKLARQVLCHLSSPPALFCVGYFQDRGSWIIFLGWPWTLIFLISASWVRIIDVSHWCPANSFFFFFYETWARTEFSICRSFWNHPPWILTAFIKSKMLMRPSGRNTVELRVFSDVGKCLPSIKRSCVLYSV
jgi:hypothetical protein